MLSPPDLGKREGCSGASQGLADGRLKPAFPSNVPRTLTILGWAYSRTVGGRANGRLKTAFPMYVPLMLLPPDLG